MSTDKWRAMKAQIEFELKPFLVPGFVLYDGFNGSQKDSVPLELIPEEALYALCKQFVENVYKKAGKTNVPQFIRKEKL